MSNSGAYEIFVLAYSRLDLGAKFGLALLYLSVRLFTCNSLKIDKQAFKKCILQARLECVLQN